eukprot:scaffold423975_cov32-Prasinocladus_malaysianus.AAC.1
MGYSLSYEHQGTYQQYEFSRLQEQRVVGSRTRTSSDDSRYVVRTTMVDTGEAMDVVLVPWS